MTVCPKSLSQTPNLPHFSLIFCVQPPSPVSSVFLSLTLPPMSIRPSSISLPWSLLRLSIHLFVSATPVRSCHSKEPFIYPACLPYLIGRLLSKPVFSLFTPTSNPHRFLFYTNYASYIFSINSSSTSTFPQRLHDLPQFSFQDRCFIVWSPCQFPYYQPVPFCPKPTTIISTSSHIIHCTPSILYIYPV